MIELPGKYTTAYIMTDDIEGECVSQIYGFINHPAFTNHVAIMPDTHAGKGSVIGFTMPLTPKVIPNVIGVDIGCGVTAVNMGHIDIDYADLDMMIRNKIPLGFDIHKRPVIDFKHDFDWKTANRVGHHFRVQYASLYDSVLEPVIYDYAWFTDLCKFIGAKVASVEASIGTLGGGNHFIEVGVDGNDNKWLIVHTGSRNFGLKIANTYQGLAIKTVTEERDRLYRERMEYIKTECARTSIGDEIIKLKRELGDTIPNDLTYLKDQNALDYYHAMIFAQQYAKMNRDVIIGRILTGIPDATIINRIESVHNFIDFDDMIIRKGAIRSRDEDEVIIPFNMRDGSLIGIGKGNAEWNYSAPHGAGRIMSRSAAKKKLSMDVYRAQMEGIFSTSVCRDTLDEAPDAYKNAQSIIDAIAPTVEIVSRIRPVYNLKASKHE